VFNPTRDQVRAFFFETWRKHRAGEPLAGLESTALAVVLEHPEYQPILADPARYALRDWTPEDGAVNPFLHLSLHLAIEEQRSIDQPPGIAALLGELAGRQGSSHAAAHAALECLGETLWRAERDGRPPDAEAYLECLRRTASA
jgi:hypothetical protein